MVVVGVKMWLDEVFKYLFLFVCIFDVLFNLGKIIDYNGMKVIYFDIKVIYWLGGNLFIYY